MPLNGSCLCGAVVYQSSSEPEATALCHCLDCQKWTGGAFTSNVLVSEDSFSVVKGNPKRFDVTGSSGKNRQQFFCGDCGSSLYSKLDVMPGKVVIKAGGLDDGKQKLDGKVQVEFFCRDRVPYLGSVTGAKQEPLYG